MNLSKLYETQQVLRDRIGYRQPDRLEKLTLALLVELGECSNEHRGFKFWSKDQKPRTEKLLEEFVDCLHFILEIGIELAYRPAVVDGYCHESVERQFLELFWEVSNLYNKTPLSNYWALFAKFVGLGELLGFTWEQIEAAYFAKNQINHLRQTNGY